MFEQRLKFKQRLKFFKFGLRKNKTSWRRLYCLVYCQFPYIYHSIVFCIIIEEAINAYIQGRRLNLISDSKIYSLLRCGKPWNGIEYLQQTHIF